MGIEQARVGMDMTSDGPRVILVMPGGGFYALPWKAAKRIGNALLTKAADAEEIEKHDQVAEDAAILAHSGAPFSLAHTKEVQREAVRILKTSDRLRRLGPTPESANVGTPGVYHKKG